MLKAVRVEGAPGTNFEGKEILLRVNSSGGRAAASQEIYELSKYSFNQAAKKQPNISISIVLYI